MLCIGYAQSAPDEGSLSADRTPHPSRCSLRSLRAEAREIADGHDKDIYRKEQRDKRATDLQETKRDIQKHPKGKPRSQSLSDRFNKANRDTQSAERKASGKQTGTPEKRARAG
jgi:hypothetical protein